MSSRRPPKRRSTPSNASPAARAIAVASDSNAQQRDPQISLSSDRATGREQRTSQPVQRHLNLQTLEFIASPFRSFREIGKFHQTLAALPGVYSVQPRQLQRGSLQLRVECRSSSDLLDGLGVAYHFPFHLVSQESHQIEIMFEQTVAEPAHEIGAQSA